MGHQPIERLIKQLNAVFVALPDSDQRTAKIRSLVDFYVKGEHQDVGKYVYFNDVHYTRNLVAMTDDFELMVSIGQAHHPSRDMVADEPLYLDCMLARRPIQPYS